MIECDKSKIEVEGVLVKITNNQELNLFTEWLDINKYRTKEGCLYSIEHGYVLECNFPAFFDIFSGNIFCVSRPIHYLSRGITPEVLTLQDILVRVLFQVEEPKKPKELEEGSLFSNNNQTQYTPFVWDNSGCLSTVQSTSCGPPNVEGDLVDIDESEGIPLNMLWDIYSTYME